jgi:hypothetical protein
MGGAQSRRTTVPFGFAAPEHANIGSINLGALLDSVVQDDEALLTAIRRQCAGDTDSLDRFVAAVRDLVEGDCVKAANEFARIHRAHWHVPATALCALATAAGGDCGGAIKIANRMSDLILDRRIASADLSTYARDAALHRETVRCIKLAESSLPASSGRLRIESPFRYIIGYPRSGNTLLAQFLSFAFAAPRYTVYPDARRYFSRRFHESAPGHAVFVKDHVLQPEYAEDAVVSPVRDGRDAMVSLARYLYVEDGSPFIQRGELADFLSYVAARMPYGFWGDHTRALFEARDHGVNIRIVRYEELFRNYEGLLALAHELANGGPVPCLDRAEYLALVARERRWYEGQPQLSKSIPLPDDSFIPRNWTVGGGTIDWHQAFDRPARRRFHDLGGTEMLIRLRYEADEDWWRQG